MTTTLRASDLLTRTLAEAGTRYLFSLSGNQIMPVYDAAIDTELRIVHVRHEAAAVHMADAWGRLTGLPGIALVTGGPGHANAIGALYTALASDSPMVLLSGHAPLGQLGMDAFQEMRQADMAAPVVKASWTAEQPEHIGADIARALRLARSGRPGPVHVSLPFDLLEAKVEQAAVPALDASEHQTPTTELSPELARTVLEQLAAARRPLVILGPVFASQKGKAARDSLARALGVPVVCMESPRGVNDPAAGALADVLAEADLVLLVAKKLDFTLRFGRAPAFAADCRFMQIDPEPEALQRARRSLGDPGRLIVSAVADPYPACERLVGEAQERSPRDVGWSNEVEAAIRYRPEAWNRLGARPPGLLHPVQVGQAVQAVIDRAPDIVLVIDGGEFGQWAQACVRAPVRLINGPAGSIGSAIPFALAAKLARPEATVVAMLGDGTFGFHMAEFDTAVRNHLPILCVVGNDACWNAEHQIQINSYGRDRTIACELLPARYDQAVAGLGAAGEFVTRADELPDALTRALGSGKPACVNVLVERLAAPTVSRRAAAGGGGH